LDEPIGASVDRDPVVPPARPADAPLGEQLDVNRTPLVVAEAVLEGVAEVVQAEVPGAAGVGAVQERAVLAGGVTHSYVDRGADAAKGNYRPRAGANVSDCR
jgi:hypothetical protein